MCPVCDPALQYWDLTQLFQHHTIRLLNHELSVNCFPTYYASTYFYLNCVSLAYTWESDLKQYPCLKDAAAWVHVGDENSFPKVPLLAKGWACNCFQSCSRDALPSSSWCVTSSHSQSQKTQQTYCLHCPRMEITQEMLTNRSWLKNHNWPFLHEVWW